MKRAIFFLMTATSVLGQAYNDFDLEPHNYYTADLKDPMSTWLARLQKSEIEVKEENGKPLLQRMLEDLKVPVSSQVLVFTKTSLQRRVVNPQNPRAIYFNEDVYAGWMPNGRIEITSMDPDVGGIFYFQRPLDEPNRPLFRREESCLGCHAGSATSFLPGLLARSVFPDESGNSLKSIRTFERVGHQVPFDQRWGGWYVTGHHGKARHLGNALATGGRSHPVLLADRNANRESLDDFFDADVHLRPDSDVLAMLLHDHQISMHHWMMEAHHRVRQEFYDAKIEGKTREDLQKLPADDDHADLQKCVNRLMRYLLFADEASLGDEAWKDLGDYRKDFLSNRKQDAQSRSLKDLRLQNHIFQYRCSYMIYSKAFAALPVPLKEEVYHRLHAILTGDVEGFGYLPAGEKKAIYEILTATLPEAAAYWGKLAAG